MSHKGPITDEQWDSWEPLVAGLPLCLRIIVFHHLVFAFLALAFVAGLLLVPPLGS